MVKTQNTFATVYHAVVLLLWYIHKVDLIITIRSSESLSENKHKGILLKFIFCCYKILKKWYQKDVPNHMLKSLPPMAAVPSQFRGFSIAVPDANVMGLLILHPPTSK
jgi:hypothetical protein